MFYKFRTAVRLRSSALSYVGQVGEVVPPFIVSSMTIEPTKPRLCINIMYIDCFMIHSNFLRHTVRSSKNC